MQCPNCNATVQDDAAFCAACGTKLVPDVPADADVPGAPVPPPTAQHPTAPLPPSAAQAAPPAPPAAAYQPPVPPVGTYQPQTAQQPPKKSKTGLVIAIVAIVLVVLLGCCIGGVFAARTFWSDGVSSIEEITNDGVDSDSGNGTNGDATAEGYATADEAVQAALDAEGLSDWVYEVFDESDGVAVYWAGPPQSEYAYAISVAQYEDGSWYLVETAAIDEGMDTPADGVDAEAAQQAVLDYLWAVYEDRGLDAQSYCVEPFVNDSASAAVSAGGLSDFGISDYTVQEDGTVWVRSYEVWYDEYQEWDYLVVPTEAGYRISELAWVEQ